MPDFEPTDLPKPKKDFTIFYVALAIVAVFGLFALFVSLTLTNGEESSENIGESNSTSSCLTAMQRASLEADSTRAEPLLKSTAYSCGSGTEWNAALREFPAAMGFDTVTGDEIKIICYKYPDAPTCLNP